MKALLFLVCCAAVCVAGGMAANGPGDAPEAAAAAAAPAAPAATHALEHAEAAEAESEWRTRGFPFNLKRPQQKRAAAAQAVRKAASPPRPSVAAAQVCGGKTCANGGTLNAETCNCACKHPWSGARCQVLCGGRQCKRGGTLNRETCQCSCPAPWGGQDCSMCMKKCENNARLHEDTCTCECMNEFHGDTCATCDLQCKNAAGATTGRLNERLCSCACNSGWVGFSCEICWKSCANGGQLNKHDCSCKCADPWIGATCATCSRPQSYCKNGGVLDTSTCTCTCVPPYHGAQCEKIADTHKGTSKKGMEVSVNRPGYDYRVFDLPEPIAELCQEQCMKDAKCVVWTYETWQGVPQCHLKRLASFRMGAHSAISGFRPIPAHWERNTNRPGQDIKMIRLRHDANPVLCETACMLNPRCKAWTFVQASPPKCYLKGGVPHAVAMQKGLTSGVKKARVSSKVMAADAYKAAPTQLGWRVFGHPTGLVPLLRYFNPQQQDYLLTTNYAELGGGRNGWLRQGNVGYCYGQKATGTIPLYRYYHHKTRKHLFTTDHSEHGDGEPGVWTYEGVACYVYGAKVPNAPRLDALKRGSTMIYSSNEDEVKALARGGWADTKRSVWLRADSKGSCPNGCSQHGLCLRYQCYCDEGWGGIDCNARVCPAHCSGNGKCVEGTCVCDDGFHGADCAQPVSFAVRENAAARPSAAGKGCVQHKGKWYCYCATPDAGATATNTTACVATCSEATFRGRKHDELATTGTVPGGKVQERAMAGGLVQALPAYAVVGRFEALLAAHTPVGGDALFAAVGAHSSKPCDARDARPAALRDLGALVCPPSSTRCKMDFAACPNVEANKLQTGLFVVECVQ